MASYNEVPRDQPAPSDAPDGAAGAASNSAPNERDMNYEIKQSPSVMLRGREVLLAIGVFFLFSVSVGLFVFMVKNYIEPKDNNDGCSAGDKPTCPPDLCLTEQCIEKAAFMLQLMNKSAPPCDDFWNYACGGWLARSVIPESYKSWGVGHDVDKRIKGIVRTLIERPIVRHSPGSSERKAKTLYRACMDVKAIDRAGKAPLERIIHELGGWAILGMYPGPVSCRLLKLRSYLALRMCVNSQS